MINIGNINVNSFKVGSADCKVYLGTNLLYPNSSPIPYENQYLTFIAKGQEEYNSYQFSGNSINYSLDSGTTWSTLQSGEWTPTIPPGHTIMWKATLTPSSVNPNYGIGAFRTNTVLGRIYVEGNVMSLLYGDNFIGQTDLSGKDYAFYRLFRGCIGLKDISNLKLPATRLSDHCYAEMFYNSDITVAPELPATELNSYCYYQMFWGCESLVTAPELPATTLYNYCYFSMFGNCYSLTTAPELPATELAPYCYSYMFNHCSGLTAAPALPASTMKEYCYQYMFQDCTSLTTAPVLSATTLANYCYHSMFRYCSGLTTAMPELPATTLKQDCYYSMFDSCSSLTESPIIRGQTFIQGCCYQMFYNCSSLEKITCLATNVSALLCTYLWVSGVKATGTFIKPYSMTGWGSCGASKIPCGWTVQSYTT